MLWPLSRKADCIEAMLLNSLFKKAFIDALHVCQLCQSLQNPSEVFLMGRADTKVFGLDTANTSRRLSEELYRRIDPLHFGSILHRIRNAELIGQCPFSVRWSMETRFIQPG